jgi:ABC-type sugar transport system substrate-binding protein
MLRLPSSPRKWVATLVLAAAVAGLAVVATGVASARTAAATAKPIVSLTPSKISSHWVVWNKKSCSFATAKKHPRKYIATVTHQPKRWKFGFATQSTTIASILVTMNNKLFGYAKKANVQLIFGDNDTGGSDQTTKPISEAQRIAGQGPAVFGSFNIFDSIMGQVLAPFKSKCIPVIQIQGQAPGTVFLGTDNAYTAGVGGKYMARYAKSHKWAASSVTIVEIQQPNLPPNLQQLWLACGKAAKAALPGATLTSLSVPVQELTSGAQTTMTNWLTGHPAAHHILVCPPSDLYAMGIANALKNSGRGGDGIIVGQLATKEARAVIKKGGSPLIASVDAGFEDLGTYSLALAEAIHAGHPVPSVVNPKAFVVDRHNVGK